MQPLIQRQVPLEGGGTRVVKYFAQNASGNATAVQTSNYVMDFEDARPVIRVNKLWLI